LQENFVYSNLKTGGNWKNFKRKNQPHIILFFIIGKISINKTALKCVIFADNGNLHYKEVTPEMQM